MRKLTLDRLFRWQMETSVTVYGKEVPIVLKTLGAKDEQMRRDLALQAAQEARKQCLDENGIFYMTRIAPSLSAPPESKRKAALAAKRVLLERASSRAVIPYEEDLPEPDTLKELAEQEDKRAKEEKEWEAERQKWTDEQLAAYESFWDALSDEERDAELRELMVEFAMEEAYMRRWIDATLWRSVYKPNGELFYSELDDWSNADQGFRDAVFAEYAHLDPSSSDPNSSSAQP